MSFEMRQCPNCRLRFPQEAGQVENPCPACGFPTQPAARFPTHPTPPPLPSPSPVYAALLDNIRSTWNVGSMFRTADGAGLRHLYLCGYTATPENPKVGKTALGAEQALTWSHHPNGVELAQTLCAEGKRLIALEGGTYTPIYHLTPAWDTTPTVLVVGNEVAGVDPDILALCETIVSIPMWGVKESLNAAVAFGIGAYILRTPHKTP
ncbi:MAG: TrmH family RNA methyltransferase [Anaerolineales bacterium]|nr:TrmH family RNA methyltransferase [Anaerolineales bacterium]